MSDGIGVDEFRVPKGGRFHAEEPLDHLGMKVDLLGEFVRGVERGKAVVEGFGEEFDLAGLGEGVESVDDFGGMEFELFHRGAGDGEGEAKLSIKFLDQLEQDPIHGEITAFGDGFDEAGVESAVEVRGIAVEDGIFPQSEGLVDLEIKTNRRHWCELYRGGEMGPEELEG